MNKQDISRQLHRLVQEEIPDNMDLWPRIQGQLKRKAKPRSFSFAYALSAFVMITLVGIGSFVAYRSASTTSQEAVSPSQSTELGIVQSGEGISVSLDWAYADAHIITLQYSVIYNPQEINFPEFSYIELRTKDGIVLSQDNNGGGGGGGGGDANSVRYTTQLSFDASAIQGDPLWLDLEFLIGYWENGQSYVMEFPPTVPPPAEGLNGPKDIYTATPIPYNGDPFALTATSIIGTATAIAPATEVPSESELFGLTATALIDAATAQAQATMMPPTAVPPNRDQQLIEPSLIPPMQFTPTPVPGTTMHLFDFSFTVPFYPAKTGEVVATNYGSNYTAAVQNLSITPAMTRFELCYNLPSTDVLWTPKISLDTGFAPSPVNMSTIRSIGADGQTLYPAQAWVEPIVQDGKACLPMTVYAPFSPEGGEMDIQLDYLYTAADATDPATWAADEAFFKERGFDLSFAFVPVAAGAEQEFYNEPRPSNVVVYPLPETGALLITLRDYPDGLEEWEASNYIYDHMLKIRTEGHWNFHVTVE